jgi:hypothetical protein
MSLHNAIGGQETPGIELSLPEALLRAAAPSRVITTRLTMICLQNHPRFRKASSG